MDCHYKAGDIIILTDEEDKANLLNPNCIIEQGVTFRFYYDEPQSNQPTIEKVRRKSTRKETHKMPEQTVPVTEQKDEKTVQETPVVAEPATKEETQAITVASDTPFDLNQVIQTTGGGASVAIILAILAIVGGGTAWKFYQKLSEQKHEQKMKELDIKAQSQGLGNTQPPACQTANAALEAKITALETKVSTVEKKSSSISAGFDPEELEERVLKIEKKVKTISSKID